MPRVTKILEFTAEESEVVEGYIRDLITAANGIRADLRALPVNLSVVRSQIQIIKAELEKLQQALETDSGRIDDFKIGRR